MKKLHLLLFTLIILLVCFSCKNINNDIVGNYVLTSWDIGMEFDINRDNTSNFNLLKEFKCSNSELLSVKSDQTISSVNTFSPTVKISKRDSDYYGTVDCAEGSIGFATSYLAEGNNLKLDTDETIVVKNNQLIRTFEKAIKIYNQDFTEVIETKDLILTYSKKLD